MPTCLLRVDIQGLEPEIVPSTFEEDLPKSEFVGEAAFEYPVETSARKALEVFERLMKESPDDPPDLVIGGELVRWRNLLFSSDN